MDEEHISSLLETSPYYTQVTIPADVYGTPTDVTTVAIAAVIVASNEVSEDAIYNFVSTVFNNLETISQQHAKGAECSLEFASSITGVPYHAGAAKYFAEQGITVPTA